MRMQVDAHLSDDAALGGRLRLLQPRAGHRFGHDAILLAAAVAAQAGDYGLELGAGVGAAGLALAARIPGSRLSLIEIDPALAALASENAVRNGFAERVTAHCVDVAAPQSAFDLIGLAPASRDFVLMNPPFNDPARHAASPDPLRRSAHLGPSLLPWIDVASRLLRRLGTLTLIFRADGLDHVLACLQADFGAIAVLPIYPRPDASAVRVLVGAVKGGRGLLALRPGLVLNRGGRPTPEAEAVLRNCAALPLHDTQTQP
jgi:tRNA1(Val) A37 N6-methylase TrmN6